LILGQNSLSQERKLGAERQDKDAAPTAVLHSRERWYGPVLWLIPDNYLHLPIVEHPSPVEPVDVGWIAPVSSQCQARLEINSRDISKTGLITKY